MSKPFLHPLLLLLITTSFIQPFLQPALASTTSAELIILDRDNQPVSSLVDGDSIYFKVSLPVSVVQNTDATFFLSGIDRNIARCVIPAGERTCETEPLSALGWYWNPGGQAQASREVTVRGEGDLDSASAIVKVSPRPVVMVHGFSSTWDAWANYLGPGGYLAGFGIPGYAVGDGQEPGVLNTGNISAPTGRTNTIAENAAILGDYIAAVRKATGAQRVDILSHSMGGLISRYYIDRLMPEGEVAQLIMLGSPMAGTDCANLPASLGFYLPAVLEIQPTYVNGIFNPQITHRRGVIFNALAGIPIQDAVQSPCTQVPSDLAVSLQSVDAIPLYVTKMSVLHIDLNTSEQVFREYVLPLLQTPASSFASPSPDPQVPSQIPAALQFTHLYSGHLNPGETRELVIQIEPGITVASFSLYDSSRSLDVIVRGASGKVLTLDAKTNGLVKVEDPSTLFYLGYAFKNPKPGAWKITLTGTERTPAEGGEYALTAAFSGGADLNVQASSLLPRINEPVTLNAELALRDLALKVEKAEARVRQPDGSQVIVPFSISTSGIQAIWKPDQAGLNYLQVYVTGRGPDNEPVERTAFLVIEAQPSAGLPIATLLLIGSCLVGIFAIALTTILLMRLRRGRLAALGQKKQPEKI